MQNSKALKGKPDKEQRKVNEYRIIKGKSNTKEVSSGRTGTDKSETVKIKTGKTQKKETN